jgi:hypothetical protein
MNWSLQVRVKSGDQLRGRRNRAARIPNGADEPKGRELARRYCQPRAPIDLLVVKDTPVKEAIGSPRAHRPDSNQVEVDLSRSDRPPAASAGRLHCFSAPNSLQRADEISALLVRRNDHRVWIMLCTGRYAKPQSRRFCIPEKDAPASRRSPDLTNSSTRCCERERLPRTGYSHDPGNRRRQRSSMGKFFDPRLPQGGLSLLRKDETRQVHERARCH